MRGESRDFRNAEPAQRWTGSLPALFRELKTRAWKARGRWAFRILPRGACVALRAMATGRYELRVSRSTRPRTDDEKRAWEIELRTFRQQFEIEHWDLIGESEGEGGGIAVVYRECQPAAQPKRADQAGLFDDGAPRPAQAAGH